MEVIRNYRIDEGWPLGISFQERVSNHHKLLWLKARVVNVVGKSRIEPVR